MTRKELCLIRDVLDPLKYHQMTYSEQIDKRTEAKKLIEREIHLKNMDPRKD